VSWRVFGHPLLITLATWLPYRGIARASVAANPCPFPRHSPVRWTHGVGGLTPAGTLSCGRPRGCPESWRGRQGAFTCVAIGNNETATRFSGVDVARLKLLLYT